MNKPQVTIVIPHFNRVKLLNKTLQSITESSISRWEVIVVDDGSDAVEFQQVQGMASERIHVLQRIDGIKGPSRCRNIGVQYASSDLVVFVDSDDLVAPWCMEQRVDAMNQSHEYDFCVFPVMLFQRFMGDSATMWNRFDSDDDLPRFLLSDPPWHTSSAIWRKTALDGIGGFNEAVMYGDDTDLHIRALLKGLRYQKHPDALPDSFVRRADTPRITNSLSSTLLASRRTRLREGSRAIALAAPVVQRAWQSQYFAEAEFMLFNVDAARQPIDEVCSDWAKYHPDRRAVRWFACLYLQIAVATKFRCYLLLRIARRLAMMVLPPEFFYRAQSFHREQVSIVRQQEIKNRLELHQHGGVRNTS